VLVDTGEILDELEDSVVELFIANNLVCVEKNVLGRDLKGLDVAKFTALLEDPNADSLAHQVILYFEDCECGAFRAYEEVQNDIDELDDELLTYVDSFYKR
jgi:hypothetical protein